MTPQQEQLVSEVLKVLPELGRALVDSVPAHAGERRASPAQMKVLVHLAEYGPQTMGDLAEGLGITTPSATGLVNPLAESGLVERERKPEDRRVVTVRLSDEARDMADHILGARRLTVEGALEGLGTDAQQHVLEGLRRLCHAFSAQRRLRRTTTV